MFYKKDNEEDFNEEQDVVVSECEWKNDAINGENVTIKIFQDWFSYMGEV